jgi:hypothetical protein
MFLGELVVVSRSIRPYVTHPYVKTGIALAAASVIA